MEQEWKPAEDFKMGDPGSTHSYIRVPNSEFPAD